MNVNLITKEWFAKHSERQLCSYNSCPICELIVNPIMQDDLIKTLHSRSKA